MAKCKVCYREACQRVAFYEAWIQCGGSCCYKPFDLAAQDCEAHAVDWRTRALAAEAERDALAAEVERVREFLQPYATHVDDNCGTCGMPDPDTLPNKLASLIAWKEKNTSWDGCGNVWHYQQGQRVRGRMIRTVISLLDGTP